MARDRVYFLAKDPHWSFVWWQLSAESLGRAAAAAGLADVAGLGPGARGLILRVHDVTEAADATDATGEGRVACDVAVAGATDHWYLELPAGRAYRARLGFRSAGGEFHAAAASNRLSLPPDGPSGRGDEAWSTVPLQGRGWRKRGTS